MVEVDPIIIVAAVSTAVMAIATIALCSKPTEQPVEKPAQPTKPKKKSKPSSKSKPASAAAKASTAAAAVAPAGKDTSKDEETVVDEATVKFQDSEEKEEKEEMVFASTETLKKSKKAKETQEQRASRLERQKTAKVVTKSEEVAVVAPKIAESYDMFQVDSSPTSVDGWAVVEKSKKVKKNEAAEEEVVVVEKVVKKEKVVVETEVVGVVVVEEVVPAAPVVETVTLPITVEARKLGLLIGPKGVTKIGLQTATGTEISMPKVEKDFTGPVELNVTGTAEGVARAIFALNELCTKGYCNLLAGADFHEGYVSVPPRYLPDIIGKGGASIKAIQQHTGIKISTPAGTRTTGEVAPSKVKILLAGNREKVAIARNLILDLTKYYHTAITHPGIVHKEMEIASNYYNYIIGSKGSEIKHIQANYKVNVHIPNAESINPHLLIVGEPEAVDKAEAHILKIIEKVEVQTAERAKAQAEGIALGESAKAKYAAANGGAPQTNPNAPMSSGQLKIDSRPPKADREEPQEEWMSEFAPRKAPINIGAMLPATAKFSAAPPAPVVEEEAPATPDAAPDAATDADAAPAAGDAPWGGLGAKTW
ncbi:hypothetical protein B484DRAFT_450216 [Ochromonadaceae sp. CCMP2298]|nr:hypothetical protein B484DRAFT_450216 [Ochromonadaceae sp. CCMP2298]